MRMRKKKNLVPRMEQCGAIWIRNPAELQGKWLSGRSEQALHLEIGCGKGLFTVNTAEREPDALLVAIERYQNALVTAMERTMARELSNVLFLDEDAAQLTELFASREVSRIYLNFSDPWPSSRHAKRRLTSPGFLDLYTKILTSDGEIHFKTDNRDLFDYSIAQFPACGYVLEQVTFDLHSGGIQDVMTDYEQKFHEMGTSICRCVARLGTPKIEHSACSLSATPPEGENTGGRQNATPMKGRAT